MWSETWVSLFLLHNYGQTAQLVVLPRLGTRLLYRNCIGGALTFVSHDLQDCWSFIIATRER
jgi:hypothetical protein